MVGELCVATRSFKCALGFSADYDCGPLYIRQIIGHFQRLRFRQRIFWRCPAAKLLPEVSWLVVVQDVRGVMDQP